MDGKMEFGFKTKQGRNVLYCVIAILIAIVFLFPIYWLLSMSFKTDAESFGKIVTYYPHDFTLDPWVQNFSDKDFLRSLKNSSLIALLSMVISIGFGVPHMEWDDIKYREVKDFFYLFLSHRCYRHL